MTTQEPIDAPSINGIFGWERIGSKDDLAIPVIVRSNKVRYSPVRIVEQQIIKRYGALPQPVFNCITLKSFYLTNWEAKLLNTINHHHCNNMYGEQDFYTRDVIISAPDVKELSRYLNISFHIFTLSLSHVEDMFGIIRLTVDLLPDQTSVMLVPYITKSHSRSSEKDGGTSKFVPTTLIDKFITIPEKIPPFKGQPSDWDIMYLKMLCIYCENGLQQRISRESQLIQLDGLMYSRTNMPIAYEIYRPPPTLTSEQNNPWPQGQQ